MPRLKKNSAPKGAEDLQEIHDEMQSIYEDDNEGPFTAEDLVSSGITPVNLRCSGKYQGAFKLGTLVNIIGDSHVGKSILALSILAEAAHDPKFDNYLLIYDDTENANCFDIAEMFGKKLADRIQIYQSRYFEEWQDRIDKLNREDQKCIYILDSFDGMKTIKFEKLQEENMKRREKGQEEKESYGDGKAKLMSSFGGRLIDGLQKTKSLCIIVSQTRQNIGMTSMFNPKIRAGGDALKFYASHEIWLAVKKKDKHAKHKAETIRTQVLAKITKNKLIGRKGEADFVVLEGYGIDNISSSLKYMCDSGKWTGTAASIDTKGFVPENMSRVKLVQKIEDEGLEEKLYQECQKVFDALMQEIKPERKKKYN